MFVTTVAWVMFCFGSFYIPFAIIDTIFQFSLSKLEKAFGMSRHYFTGRMAFISVSWFLSGWFLFG